MARCRAWIELPRLCGRFRSGVQSGGQLHRHGLGARDDLDEPPVTEAQDPVRGGEDLGVVRRHEQSRGASAAREQLDHLASGGAVEMSGRFVG
jgi:hypothetical protein